MSADLTFSDTDFFYNNINAPIKFNPNLCTLSDVSLNEAITKALNLPNDITHGVLPKTDQTAGQCTLKKATADDEKLDQKFKAKSWKLNYVGSGINQKCSCSKADPIEYIPYDNLELKYANATDLKEDVEYVCKNSIPVTIKDKTISDITLDQTKKQQLINSTVQYYKAACANKDKSVELIKTNSVNQDSDLKYEDTKEFYNREYINRINLGIGIITTCGFIFYTFISGSQSITPSA